jgi:hypothetical protein
MPYRSDRQLVELMIPVIAAFDLVLNGATEKDEQYHAAVLHLKAATEEIVGTNATKIMRRAERAYRAAMADHVSEGREVSKAGLITFHWLSAVLGSGYLVMSDDAPLSKAFEIILPALQHVADIPAVNASAEKQARHVLTRFQSQEFYCGVEIHGADVKEAA